MALTFSATIFSCAVVKQPSTTYPDLLESSDGPSTSSSLTQDVEAFLFEPGTASPPLDLLVLLALGSRCTITVNLLPSLLLIG